MIYNEKLGYTTSRCTVCGIYTQVCQHHLTPGAGRYHSEVIWVCNNCHAKIHSNIAWARDNGYITKGDPEYKKREKKKKCLHKKVYRNPVLDCYVCIICGERNPKNT